jgi:putative YhbY family RNA-binding protein
LPVIYNLLMKTDQKTGVNVAASVLTGRQRRELRARAHALKPVVRIAGSGISPSVLREIDRALLAHELIKIHAAIDDRNERSPLLQSICDDLDAQPVQVIGKMLVAFRPKPQTEPAPATVTGPGLKRSKKRPARAGKARARR